MDLTQLSKNLKIKTDFDANARFGLSDINSITGIVDNSVTSLQALIFSNRNAEYDDFDPTNYDVTGITSGYDKKCFIFDLKKEYKFLLSSDITDHYVEENLAIQDQIALKPIMLEVTGSIGEVDFKSTLNRSKLQRSNEAKIASEIKTGQKDFTPIDMFNATDSYLDRMGSLTSFAPNLVNQSLQIYNSAKSAYVMANKVINLNKQDSSTERQRDIEGYNEDTIKQTKQFEWINWFRTQWEKRASFTIVTPYGVLYNMYILDLSASQPENTRYVTNLSIKFKQIRKATTIRRGKKAAQKVEVQETKQASKQEEQNVTEEEAKKIIQQTQFQDEYPIEEPNTGDVTQVTTEQWEEYKQIVSQSLNVAKPTLVYSKSQVANNLNLFPKNVPVAVGGI